MRANIYSMGLVKFLLFTVYSQYIFTGEQGADQLTKGRLNNATYQISSLLIKCLIKDADLPIEIIGMQNLPFLEKIEYDQKALSGEDLGSQGILPGFTNILLSSLLVTAVQRIKTSTAAILVKQLQVNFG